MWTIKQGTHSSTNIIEEWANNGKKHGAKGVALLHFQLAHQKSPYKKLKTQKGIT
jgi:hypothetical protein